MALLHSSMVPLGSPAHDFHLKGIDGEMHSLVDYAEAKVLVLVFMCNHCPYVQAIWDDLVALEKRMPNEVRFLGINANANPDYPEDSFEKMKEYAKAKWQEFPYLYDENQEVAKAYDARCTPDIFVYDEDYIKVINLVEIIGGNLGWTYKDRQPLKGVRHKREFFPDHEKHDIFSVIPVYKFNGKIKFVYDKDIILENILTQEKRTIENHSFFTPSAAFLRELFICSWEGKKLSKERQQDAKIILAQYQHG